MSGTLQLLLIVKKFLMHLLPGAQPGVHDLYVVPWLKPGKLNHLLGQVTNSNGFAHIKHKYVPAVANGSGLQNKACRLRNSHEITSDLRVRHSHRPTGRDLTLE